MNRINDVVARLWRLFPSVTINRTPKIADDRKRIAVHLYGKAQWTMQAIATALKVNQRTVSRDLVDLDTVPKSKAERKTATNPNVEELERRQVRYSHTNERHRGRS